MPDNYDMILREEGGLDLLRRLSPHEVAGDHCLEAADAVHDFLNTGIVSPVRAGGSVSYRMDQDVLNGFQTITLQEAFERVRVLGHGHHIVIRAVRARPRPRETRHHYFVLARIRQGTVAIDAFGQLIIQGWERIAFYVQNVIGIPPGHLEYASRGFDVEARDLLEEDFPEL